MKKGGRRPSQVKIAIKIVNLHSSQDGSIRIWKHRKIACVRLNKKIIFTTCYNMDSYDKENNNFDDYSEDHPNVLIERTINLM